MKKLIIAISLLCVIVAGGIVEHFHVDKTFDQFTEKCDALDVLILAEDTEGALAYCKDMSSWWDEKRDLIEAFSYAQDTRMISVTLGEIEGSLEASDLKNSQSKVVSLRYLLDNVHEILDFNVRDIF